MKTPKKNQRRRLLIEPPFQMKMAFIGCIIAAVEVLIASVIIMFVAMTSIWIPAGDHIVVFYKFVMVIALMLAGMTILNVYLALWLSHRIAGPVYRLKQSMQQAGSGDLSVLIKFREKDELQDLKNEFNNMISNIRDRVMILQSGSSKKKEKQGKKAAAAQPHRTKKSEVASFKLD
ncbi:HAMP domain-containing protein [bacterium]|nr:HAMP domain-containing protein [bacterium]